MPLSGTIADANGELENAPEALNQDPYGKGWMIKITMNDASEADALLSPEAYAALLKEQE